MSRRLARCLALLLLFPAGVSGQSAPSRRVVLDFENPAAVRVEVIGERDKPGGAVANTSQRPGSAGGNALRIEYGFTDPLVEEVSAVVGVGDLDARSFDHVSFRIRGDAAAGFAPNVKVGFRQPDAVRKRPGLVITGSQVVGGITGEWREITLPLNLLSGIGDWSRVTDFFVSIERRRAGEARKGAYEIDDVALVATGRPGPSVRDAVPQPSKIAWEESLGGRDRAKRRLAARLGEWPKRFTVPAGELPAEARPFLERVARDTWRGLVGLTDREHGIPVDHVRFPNGSLAPEEADVGDYTNITNVGLYLMAIAAAERLGFLDHDTGIARTAKALGTLESLETHQGFFFNYYDTVTLERGNHLVSFVDSAWIAAGLIVVRTSFPELALRATVLLDRANFGFFYDPVKQQMSHGVYVNVPTRSEYHYGLLYTEARLGSLIAIGKGEVPEEHWFRMSRTLPADREWQTQKPRGRKFKTVRGHRFAGGWYEWQGERYVPSWGGSMFEALMPTIVLDELRLVPRSLGRNGAVHVRLQSRYAAKQLRYPVWGVSPSAIPKSPGGYGEFGIPILGVIGYEGGAVTPHAAALALAFDRDGATSNLRELATRYPVYGDWGFYDAVDPVGGAVATAQLSLDQAMILLAVTNALTDGAIQKRFAADPIVRRALPLVAQEDFFR